MPLNCFKCESQIKNDPEALKKNEGGNIYFKCPFCHFRNFVKLCSGNGARLYELNIPLLFFNESKINEAMSHLAVNLSEFNNLKLSHQPTWVAEYVQNALNRMKRGHRPQLVELEVLKDFLEKSKAAEATTDRLIFDINLFSKYFN